MRQMDAGRSPQEQLRRRAPLLAALLAVLAAWFAWSGVAQLRSDARERELTGARDGLVTAVVAVMSAQAGALDAGLKNQDVQSALAGGDASVAAAALSAGIKGVEQAQFLPTDL